MKLLGENTCIETEITSHRAPSFEFTALASMLVLSFFSRWFLMTAAIYLLDISELNSEVKCKAKNYTSETLSRVGAARAMDDFTPSSTAFTSRAVDGCHTSRTTRAQSNFPTTCHPTLPLASPPVRPLAQVVSSVGLRRRTRGR